MSQAFVREGEDMGWEDIPPTLTALRMFLTRENNGYPITERSSYQDAEGRRIHVLSNGLSYRKDHNGKWQVV